MDIIQRTEYLGIYNWNVTIYLYHCLSKLEVNDQIMFCLAN